MIALINKPSDYDLTGPFIGSGFGVSEVETIARNIMVLLKHEGDEFRPFTWEGYKEFCSHEVSSYEEAVMEAMVLGGPVTMPDLSRPMIPGGCLDQDGKGYWVNEYFLELIKKWKR